MHTVSLKHGNIFIAVSYTLWPIHLTKNPSPASVFPSDGDGVNVPAGDRNLLQRGRHTPELQLHCSGRKSPDFPAFCIFSLSKHIFKVCLYKWVSHGLTFTDDKGFGEVHAWLLLTYQTATVSGILSGNKPYSFCCWLTLYFYGPLTSTELKSNL